MDSLAGKLLVATPLLEDANFRRSVVILLAHDVNGAFGVVLNRPLARALVADHMSPWAEHAAAPATVFAGGPVEPGMALGLATARTKDEQDGWKPLAGGVGLLDLARRPEEVPVEVERMRVFSGYAGWGAGQLEGEIEQKAWFVVNSRPGDVFTQSPEDLWRQVLLREGGEARIYAFFPETPGLN